MQRNILLTNKALQHLNPRELGEEWCAPDFHMGPSYRPYYLLHYIFSGSGTFRIGEVDHVASKGQLCILRPYDVMNYRADAKDPWHYCWVGFECSLDIPILKTKSLLDMQQAEHLFQQLKDADLFQHDREYYVCGKLYELLAMFQQLAAPSKNRTVDFIFKVKNHIDTNYHLPITMAQLAWEMHVNRSYFSTAFRKFVGRSPQQYLIDVRLEHAAELLAGGGCSVGTAAARCGYPDVYTFSRMFKKKYGVAPSEYAKK